MRAETRLLTLAETAEWLRISTRTVQRLISCGQLRPTRIGRRVLIREREVEAYESAAYRRVV